MELAAELAGDPFRLGKRGRRGIIADIEAICQEDAKKYRFYREEL